MNLYLKNGANVRLSVQFSEYFVYFLSTKM